MTVCEAIETLIRRYYAVPKDTVDVPGLIELQRKIVLQKYKLAAEVGGLYKARNEAEFRRKAAYMRKRAEAMDGGASAAKAEVVAASGIVELMEVEARTDGEWKAANLLLEATADVIQTMRQQIANLRQERRDEFVGNGSQGS